MRILQVRFKNLNSLVGEWSIDLAHPAYASDGIFAITGPTGAGKSTILDAICLALYGRTPRLNKVTKSSNEVMSRLTGKCFAEVTFETQAGRFRCHWSQHRARKSPDGELQQPKHEIADAVSGQIFKTRLRGVADQIVNATGMDFHQFSRSMLLAQGDFAAFLLAAPDERSPILEQITGTGIYSQISVSVHERRASEAEKLKLLLAELAGMQLLSDVECRQLRDDLEQKVLQEAQLSRQVQEKNRAIAWLDGIVRLETELHAIHAQKLALESRQAAFEPERMRLVLARRALELSGDYAGLQALREAQQVDQAALEECRRQLPELEHAALCAEQTFVEATANLDREKSCHQQMSAVIRQARALDLKIEEKAAPIQAAVEALDALAGDRQALLGRITEDQGLLAQANAELVGARRFLDEHVADAGLVQQMAGISARFKALRELYQERSEKAAAIASAEHRQTAAQISWQKRLSTANALGEELAAAEAAVEETQRAMTAVLGGRESSCWRNALAASQERSLLLEQLVEIHGQMTGLLRQQGELQERQKALGEESARLSTGVNAQLERVATLEREAQHCETQVTLLNRIKDLETARHQLRDGEACPLCGALEHPFAQGNVPAPNAAMAALEQVRSGLRQANEALTSLKTQEAAVLMDVEKSAENQKEKTALLEVAEARFAKGLKQLNIEFTERTSRDFLNVLQREATATEDKARTVVQAVESIEKELGSARETREYLKESLAAVNNELQAAAHQNELAQQVLARLNQETVDLAAQYAQRIQEISRELAGFGVGSLSAEILGSVEDELLKRGELWRSRDALRVKLEKQMAVLEASLRPQSANLEKLKSGINDQQTTLQKLVQERDALILQRRDVFGENNPDEEEARLTRIVTAAEASLHSAREAVATANLLFANQKTRLDELAKSLALRADKLTGATQQFAARLGTSDFADEDSYQKACLSADERNQLIAEEDRLSSAKIDIEARERDRTDRLLLEKNMHVTTQSRELLSADLEVLATNLKALQQTVGGISQRLQDNENLRDKQQDRIVAIEAQKRECSRWDTLHELIGSADGKKYRNFAQGLTFEMMVRHANRQLQKMTDRYVLIRDSIQPLELNVIDNYQAGEIRSTKNLSGGESFIVSLALALGLSHMASRNVRVDSLFLDEGFGTLDEDALDTALETLAGLQQDGKLIGIISHVVALKERIGTQIQVDPQSGGRSVLSGPGCKRGGEVGFSHALVGDVKI